MKEDYELFLQRAGFYSNVWNAEKGFMWPKDAEGNWIEPFDPKFGGGQGGRAYFDENNAWTYNWDVLHDFDGLFELMGGREAAEAKLDELFREGLGRSKYDFWYKYPGFDRVGRAVRHGQRTQLQYALSVQSHRFTLEDTEAYPNLAPRMVQ